MPILRSTGVNTKLLPALQWGVPIVLTSVAASPLQIDDSVALLADDADAFASALVRIGTTPDLRARFAAAASAHWARLLREDASAPELRALMRLVRPAIAAPPAARPLPAPVAARAGDGRPLLLPAPVASDLFSDLKGARRQNRTHGTGCFAEGARPPAILYLMHGASLPDAAALFMHTLWGSLCAVCNLKCAHGRRPAARTGWDVLIDHEASVRPEVLAAAVNHAAKHIAPREAEVGVNFRLFLGEGCDDDALFEPSDYAMSLAELQIVGGSKNDGVRQVVTYEHAPFESILGLPRSGLVAPPLVPCTSLSYQPSNPEAATAAVKAAALTATY